MTESFDLTIAALETDTRIDRTWESGFSGFAMARPPTPDDVAAVERDHGLDNCCVCLKVYDHCDDDDLWLEGELACESRSEDREHASLFRMRLTSKQAAAIGRSLLAAVSLREVDGL